MPWSRCCLLASLAFATAAPALAAGQAPQPQRGGTFHEPPARVDPVYLPQGPDQPQGGDPQPRLTLTLATEIPLRRPQTGAVGNATQGTRRTSPTLQLGLRYVPFERRHWFAQLTFLRYLHADRQQPWHPDFTYSFGHDDWRPGGWILTYANYTGTRFTPDRAAGEGRFHFPQGQWSAGRRFALPETLEPLLLAGDGDTATCAAQAHWMPRYVAAADGQLHRHKLSASLGCRYTRPEGWFFHFTAYAWPERERQQPWDPDYTWGLGWQGAEAQALTLQYNNWSGNRWPGRERGPGEGTVRSGSVTLSWQLQW